MPSSATPSPLDQLAGIEQMLRDEGHAMPLTHARRQRFMERADYLAGLGKVLAEWREAFRAANEFSNSLPKDLREWPRDAAAVGARVAAQQDAAEIALYRWLTSDSPRQAGEEITDG